MVKRSIINMNQNNGFEYLYIDHIRGGFQFGAPGSAVAWKSGQVWMQQIDTNGWPTYSSTTKTGGISGIYIPASTDFAGPYTLDGQGSGRLQLAAGTWTLGSSTGVTQISNGVYDVVDQGVGNRWTMQLTYSGARVNTGLNAQRNDPSATGAYLRNIRLYRTTDASDLALGRIFRTPWKQALVDANFSVIRVMNWTGGNNARNCRFENRTKPGYASWTPGTYNWTASPPYGETTGVNQYTLSAVTGTPASMQHGEIATCRIGSAAVRAGSITVSAITKASPGSVTATAHGFNTGDVIVHVISAGMTQVDHFPVTITVVDADHYTIGIDTSAFTTFTSGVAEQFITLAVGSGNDRTAYPVVFEDGTTTACHFAAAYIAAGDYKTFYFDKTMAGQRDSSGNWILGAWIFNNNGPDLGHSGGTPLEGCVALVNELMAMTTKGPIDLWINIPHWGMSSMDPDYSVGSNWGVNAVDVCLNGTNGFAGLDARSQLFIEYSNETWNGAGSAFYQNLYLKRRGFLRWTASGTTDSSSMASLRSMVMVQDILAGGFDRSRFKFVLGGQGTVGVSAGNSLRINGSSFVLADALNPTAATPMSIHDYFAWGGYFFANAAFDTANLTTLAAAWVSHAGDAVAQEADCASYVVGIVNTGVTTSGNETIYRYGTNLLPAYAGAMTALGKKTLMYEGGWDHTVTAGTPDQNNFLIAVKRSRAWANALRSYHNYFDTQTDALYPSDYIQLDARWGHQTPDSYANAVGGVEWSGLDLAWQYLALRNNGKRRLVVNT